MSCLYYTLPCTTFACDRGFKRCDEAPHNSTTNDCGCFGPRDRPCEDCCLCLSPIAFMGDIALIIPRCLHLMCLGCNDMYNNCSKKDEKTMIVEDAI